MRNENCDSVYLLEVGYWLLAVNSNLTTPNWKL